MLQIIDALLYTSTSKNTQAQFYNKLVKYYKKSTKVHKNISKIVE